MDYNDYLQDVSRYENNVSLYHFPLFSSTLPSIYDYEPPPGSSFVSYSYSPLPFPSPESDLTEEQSSDDEFIHLSQYGFGNDAPIDCRDSDSETALIDSEVIEKNPFVIDGALHSISNLHRIDAENVTTSPIFRTTQHDLVLIIDPLIERSCNPEAIFDAILDNILTRSKPEQYTNPRVGMSFRQEGKPDAFHIPLRPYDTVKTMVIRRELERSAQSNDIPDPVTGGKIDIKLQWVDYPAGSGNSGRRKRRYHRNSDARNITKIRGTFSVQLISLSPCSCGRGNGIHQTKARFCIYEKVAVHLSLSISRYATPQRKAAVELQKVAGIRKDHSYDVADIELLQKAHPEVQLIVFDGSHHRQPIFMGEYVHDASTIGLRLKDGHFDHIKRIAGFFSAQYYCAACDVLSNEKNAHYNCHKRCSNCGHRDLQECHGNYQLSCTDCEKTFTSHSCFQRHKATGVRGGSSMCTGTKRCTVCNQIRRDQRTGRKHRCFHNYCHTCTRDMPIDHDTCFISRVPELRSNYQKRTIVFDIESTTRIAPNGQRQHQLNLIIALRSCSACEDQLPADVDDDTECTQCGGKKLHIWKALEEEEEVKSSDSSDGIIASFADWLFSPQHRDFTAIAHNMRGFDGQFLLHHLAGTTPLSPDILAGRKLLYLDVCGVRVVDSLCFLPFPLAQFPEAFDIAIDFIRSELGHGRTAHSTFQSEARSFLTQRLRSSPYLMEFLVRMFYYDFKLFSYSFPEGF